MVGGHASSIVVVGQVVIAEVEVIYSSGISGDKCNRLSDDGNLVCDNVLPGDLRDTGRSDRR